MQMQLQRASLSTGRRLGWGARSMSTGNVPNPRARVISKGVTIETIQEGDKKTFPQKGQMVRVHYTGTLTNGTKFDSSRDRDRPFEFLLGLGMVIKGWDEGLAQMSLGERAKLTCSPDYAYGARGYPPVIPPNSTLIFDVELLAIK